jgi:hypothetical protein
MRLWPAFLLGLHGLAGQGASGETLNVDGEITSLLARDQDGDGLVEIWVSYHKESQRFLGIFRGAGAYSRSPDTVVPVDPQAIFYVVGDHDPAPGLELLLFSRTSGVKYPLASGAAPNDVRRIVQTELFFNMPSRSGIPAWLSERKLDIDGDGLDDLVIPEKHRLRLLFGGMESHAWRETSLPVTYYLLTDTREGKIQEVLEDFAAEDKTPTPLLDASGAYPFPLFLDFDGDGRLDVILRQPGFRLEVFRQTASGAFSSRPELSLHLPHLKDASSFDFADLNGDRRLDAVLCHVLLKDLATDVKVYLQAPEKKGRGFLEPAQELRVQGFFRRPDLADVNGDHRLDCLVSTYRVDLLEQLKKSSVDELEITHEVFLGAAATPFERRPSFQEKFSLRIQAISEGEARPFLYAGHDLTGDGRADLLFVDNGHLLRLFQGTAGSPPRFVEDTAFSEKVEDPRGVEIVNLDGRGGEEVILRYPRRLQIYRGKR